jgi:hypothetical protein
MFMIVDNYYAIDFVMWAEFSDGPLKYCNGTSQMSLFVTFVTIWAGARQGRAWADGRYPHSISLSIDKKTQEGTLVPTTKNLVVYDGQFSSRIVKISS